MIFGKSSLRNVQTGKSFLDMIASLTTKPSSQTWLISFLKDISHSYSLRIPFACSTNAEYAVDYATLVLDYTVMRRGAFLLESPSNSSVTNEMMKVEKTIWLRAGSLLISNILSWNHLLKQLKAYLKLKVICNTKVFHSYN